jgi:hypothetical protein
MEELTASQLASAYAQNKMINSGNTGFRENAGESFRDGYYRGIGEVYKLKRVVKKIQEYIDNYEYGDLADPGQVLHDIQCIVVNIKTE